MFAHSVAETSEHPPASVLQGELWPTDGVEQTLANDGATALSAEGIHGPLHLRLQGQQYIQTRLLVKVCTLFKKRQQSSKIF